MAEQQGTPSVVVHLRRDEAHMPRVVTGGRTAYEFRSCTSYTLPVQCNVLVRTGVSVELPAGYTLHLYAEPLLAMNMVYCLNSRETGEIVDVEFHLYNGGVETRYIYSSDIIGHGIFLKNLPPALNLAQEVELKTADALLHSEERRKKGRSRCRSPSPERDDVSSEDDESQGRVQEKNNAVSKELGRQGGF